MKKEMTIHAALSYLKTADKRIDKGIHSGTYVTYAKVGADKVKGVNVVDFENEAKSNYQSVTDILKEVSEIKKAISKANAENTITVCGETMSVASAIYMMNYGLKNYKELLNELRTQYSSAKISVDRKNGDELEERADAFIQSIYGNKEKATGADAIAAREDFKKKNCFEIIDPLKILNEINRLSAWIDEFEATVDGEIQVSNATHTIVIDV